MDSTPNNSPFPPNCKMDLYARAAAVLYGIISFDDFFKILNVYYGEGSLSQEKIMRYFWTSKNNDPIYYIQDELIVHTSIPPNEIAQTLFDIRHPLGAKAPEQHRILQEKEFLLYANPFYYEDTPESRKIVEYFVDTLGLSLENARETVAEMVFVCRSGSSPTLLMDALARRGYPMAKESEMDLILMGIDLEAETRQWERLGATGREMAGR